MKIPFIDLASQQRGMRERLDAAIARVLDSGHYVMGPEVGRLEELLANFCGAEHCLSCANGTDALQLALMALKAGTGDAVFVPSFTFAATAEVVPMLGATPFFVDVDPETFNIDPASLKRSIVAATEMGLQPHTVIPVDLFGLPADFDAILAIAHESSLYVVDDAAQGFGARHHNRVVGSIGDISTTSFFPAKPLGGYGDGGAIFTNNDEFAHLIDSYRVHGRGADKYDNPRIGINSRLDTLQAAILIEKLAVFPAEIEARQTVAAVYNDALRGRFGLQRIPEGMLSTWAQYTIKTSSLEERNELQSKASTAGIPTAIYYPIPLHRQTAYADFPKDPSGVAVSEDLATRVISLPFHPYLTPETQDQIISTVL